ncbi:MAG: hypothetical protein WAN47_11200 [Nitrosotalea sp.]
MSVEERLNTILPAAEAELGNRNFVAILGLSGVGKTVLVTLLGHALDKYFLKKQSEIKGRITGGRVFLETCENGMLDGIFPERTQLLAREEIVIEMNRSGGTGKAIEIRLPDISGETFNTLCLGDEISAKERALKIFETSKPKGKTFGDMTYVIYAKIYLILLDCSKIGEWEKLAIRHNQALATIKELQSVRLKKEINKIESPIGIVLTKSDTLSNPDEPAKSVVDNNMGRFLNTLDSLHKGEKEFFKLHVDVERNTDNAITDPTALKVRRPLTYSHDEYMRLLKWIHDNSSE